MLSGGSNGDTGKNRVKNKVLSKICPVWTSASSRFSNIFLKWDKLTLVVIINDYKIERKN